MSRKCFIGATPYQILAYIFVVQNDKVDADIYILNHFIGSDELASKLRSLNIFSNVYHVIDPFKRQRKKVHTKVIGRVINYFDIFCDYINLNLFVEKYIHLENNYDSVYIVNLQSEFQKYVYLYFAKFGKKLYFCDDGIGSYCNPNLFKFSKADKIAIRLLFRLNHFNIKYNLKLYDPDLFLLTNNGFSNPVAIEKICKIKKSSENNYIIKTLFSGSDDCFISQKYIYLDTIRKTEYNKLGQAKIKQITGKINSVLGIDNIIYKPHPRDLNFDNALPHIKKSNIPFECYLYYNNFDQKVLITNFSTAAFVPKLLFDQEPDVIFLYEILKNEMVNITEGTDLIKHFKTLYKDKNKIHIPGNEEDLLLLLDKFKIMKK